MTNIASVLKSEISRIARKEVRAEIDSLKKASAQYRSAIAQLRREVSDLNRKLKQADRAAQSSSHVAAHPDSNTTYGSKGSPGLAPSSCCDWPPCVP